MKYKSEAITHLAKLKADARKYAERYFKFDEIMDKADKSGNNRAWVEAKESRLRAGELWDARLWEIRVIEKRAEEVAQQAQAVKDTDSRLAEKAATEPAKVPMTNAESLATARAASAEKALQKQFRCIDQVVRTRKQIVDWRISLGAKIVIVNGVRALETPDRVWHSENGTIGKAGIEYAIAQLAAKEGVKS